MDTGEPMNEIIINKKSKFQHIVVARDMMLGEGHILYLDDAWQYSTAWEKKYHEFLVQIPMCHAPSIDKVLICGGGDGLAAREVLKFPSSSLDLVEIDEEIINLYRSDPMFTRLNRSSLNDERCNVAVEDAVKFCQEAQPETYDLAIVDFPSPGDDNEDKQYENLFSAEVLEKILKVLKPEGILATQTSVVTRVHAAYLRALHARGYYTWVYDSVYCNDGTHDNFTIASKVLLQKTRDIRNCTELTEAHLKAAISRATEFTPEHVTYMELFENAEILPG